MVGLTSTALALWLLLPAAGSDEIALGIYGPLTSLSATYLATAVAFDIDFRKNYNATLAARFGPPVVAVPSLHPALRIKSQIGTSDSNPEVGVSTALDMFQGVNGQEPIRGLVGGYHSAISVPIAHLASGFKVPQVSWGSTSPKLSNKDNYPWFLRTIPPDSIQAKAMWGFVGYFKVPSVTFTYSQESYGEGLFQAMLEEASAAGEGFRVAGVGVQYFPSDYDMGEARAKVARIRGMASKIVMLAMTADQGREFTKAMEEAGVTSGGWQVIGSESVGPGLVPILDVVGYTYFQPVSRASLFADFENLWTRLTPDDVIGVAARRYYNIDKFLVSLEDGERKNGISMVSDSTFADVSAIGLEEPFLFDAAYALVMAANSLLNEGAALADVKGEALLGAVRSVSFEGISGRVAFDDRGDRAASYTFDNVQPDTVGQLSTGTVLRKAGSYSAATGEISMDMELYWMTGTTGSVVPDTLVSCEPGFWRDFEGDNPTLMCYECEPGTISAGGTASRCDPCGAGTAANAGRGATHCFDCAPGNFSAQTKSTRCSQCMPGSYQGSGAATTCHRCKVGAYSEGLSQTACVSCSEGKKHPGLYSTQQQMEVDGKLTWVPIEGAVTEVSCGCREGAYEKEGECTECGQGMICPGMGEVFLQPTYFATADAPGFVFRCFGSDGMRCPGGVPGTCATGRLNSSIACSSCANMMRPGANGACEVCSVSDHVPLVVSLVLGVMFTVVLYRAVDTERPASRNRALLLTAITGSQTITLFQQLTVLGSITLDWRPPLKDIMKFLAIFTFKLDNLYLECVTRVDPVAQFFGRVFAVIGFFLSMVLVHAIFVVVLHKGSFRERMPTLIGSVGTLFSAFFISIVSSMLSPFQCSTSPNGVQTVNAYSSVVCFDSSYGSSHNAMLGISIVACIAPLGFMAVVAYVVKVLPSKLASGETDFLHMFAFLFFRFRPKAYRYILIFLVRNLLISLVPVIRNPTLQIFVLQCIVIPVLVAAACIRPWAVLIANVVDVMTTVFLSMLLTVFALFTSEGDAEFLAVLGCFLLALALVVLVASLILSFHMKFLRHRKPFQFFLCHHKAGAGNFARLLKMYLVNAPQVTEKVFMDSDDLQDLGDLFGTVASETETLVVLCSKEILCRPWCMGEVSTAKVNGVNVVKVLLPDFAWPDHEFINNYEVHVPDASSLAKHGLSLALVKESIMWLSSQRAITFPQEVNVTGIKSLVSILVKSHSLKHDVSVCSDGTPSSSSSKVGLLSMPCVGSTNCILADPHNMEACCTALVLHRLLAPIMQIEPKTIPVVLDDLQLPLEGFEQLCLICTNGVFRCLEVLRALMQATEAGMAVLPVVSEPSFRFPTKDFMNELEQDCNERLQRIGLDYAGYVLVKVAERIFAEIAIEVNPQDAQRVLRVRAQAVAQRLRGGLRPLGLNVEALMEAAPVRRTLVEEESFNRAVPDTLAMAIQDHVPASAPAPGASRLAPRAASILPL